jgi:uncharacterized spore protein YtfJ
MELMEILSKVMEKLKKHGGVELSFGESQKVGDLTIIPLARVAYGFGGGKGPAISKKKKKAKVHTIDGTSEEMIEAAPVETTAKEELGMGGGGGMQTMPVGIFTFKGDKVRFYPVVSFKEMGVTIAILIMMLWRLFRRK